MWMLLWQIHNNTVMLLSSSANHNTACWVFKYHRKCGKVQQRIVIYLDWDKNSCFVVTFSALHLNATVEHSVSSLHIKGHFSVGCGGTQQQLFFLSNSEWKHKELSIPHSSSHARTERLTLFSDEQTWLSHMRESAFWWGCKKWGRDAPHLVGIQKCQRRDGVFTACQVDGG